MSTGPNLRGRALGYLARREHSRLELEKKLTPYAPTVEELSFYVGLIGTLWFFVGRADG